MAPVKFDDIPKVATEVLNDDYQVSGYVLKAKQKTKMGNSVLSTQVDFQDKGTATPAKLAWKIPAPLATFGMGGHCIDKLEMDKAGKFKLETTSSYQNYPGLKVNCKSDLVDKSSISVGCTYTGLKDTQLKFEGRLFRQKDMSQVCNGEATYSFCPAATCGLKFNGLILGGLLPDVGLRLVSGPLFCSVLAKEEFKSFSAAAHYKANPDLRCAAVCNYSKKGTNVTVGCSYKGLYKVKVTQDQTISCSAKHAVAKGFTLLGGASYSVPKGSLSYGLQLSIE